MKRLAVKILLIVALLSPWSYAWVASQISSRRRPPAVRSTCLCMSLSKLTSLSPTFVARTNGTLLQDIETIKRENGSELLDRVDRAIEQVYAIFDLYSANAVSSDLVMTTLEGLISRSCRSPLEESTLSKIEELVWRCENIRLKPSTAIFESLWDMQQMSQKEYPTSKPSKLVGRRVKLLDQWNKWHFDGDTSAIPTGDFFTVVLDYALQGKEGNVTMSFAMWDLYRQFHDKQQVMRPAYERILLLLSKSTHKWQIRRTKVLQDMVFRSKLSSEAASFYPTISELKKALQSAARFGRTQDAAWILRLLTSNDAEMSAGADNRRLFLESILNNQHPGSALYMERLVLSDEWRDQGSTGGELLLRKLSNLELTGIGSRSEAVLSKMIHMYPGWSPDSQYVSHVVKAYLNEPDLNFQHILDADKFVRKCVNTFGMKRSFNTASTNSTSRVFDRLFCAYSSIAITDKVAARAFDSLFQFYLSSHRDGVVEEEPNQYHLQRILHLWNRSPSKLGAEKSLEYYRLVQSLRIRGIIQNGPDAFNTRQILGTLAKSQQPGYGFISSSILESVVQTANQDSDTSPYALGHMFHSVIKCNCQERTMDGIDQAMSVLERLETMHRHRPDKVRLSGAAYQTILSALKHPSLIVADAPAACDHVDRLVYSIEQQHAEGNKRARLTDTLYLDAMHIYSSHPDGSKTTQRIEKCQKMIGNVPV